jgi:hypothetical protein
MKMDRKRSMKNSGRLFFAIIALLFLSGCQSSEKEKAFLDLYPGVDFNQEIVLDTMSSSETNGNSAPWVELVLENHSSEIISYNSLEGTNLYTYSKETKEWVQIKDRLQYFDKPDDDILYPQGTRNALYKAFVLASPDLDGYTAPVVVRVVAIGHQTSDGKLVGAYYDSILLPQQ